MSKLAAMILTTREAYLNGRAESLEAINAGHCADFADDVQELLREADIDSVHGVSLASFQIVTDDEFSDGRPFDRKLLQEYWPNVLPPQNLTWDDLDQFSADADLGDGTHVWLTDDTLHFDAECPEGTANFFDLPFFQRAITSWQAERSLDTPRTRG